MRQFSKTVLIGDLLLSSIYSYADEGERDYVLTLTIGGKKVTSFTLDNAESSSFKITDQNQNLIYSKESETNRFEISTTISLEDYSSEIYFLEIIENGKVTTHQINVAPKKAKAQTVNQIPSLHH